MSLRNAFDLIINLRGKEMTIERGATSETIKAAPSNYFRNFDAIEEMNVEGLEFVISQSDLETWGRPKRGDYLIDSDLGENMIGEAKPLTGLGGVILGYRVRTE